MSLINEALKKAQRQRAADATSTSAGESGSRAVAKRSRALRAQTVILLAVGATVLIVFSVVLTVYWLNDTPASPPSVATRLSPLPATAPVDRPPATVSLPATSSAGAQPSPATNPEAPLPPGKDSAESSRAAQSAQVNPVAGQPAQARPAEVAAVPPAHHEAAAASGSPAAESPAAPSAAAPRIVVPLPDPRIQAFVDTVHVAGIRSSGAESKVLMNDRVYRVNDIVDRALGIRLIKVEPDTLTFADANGVVYTRTF